MPAKSWIRILSRYREPSPRRSAIEITLTAVPLLGL